MGLWYRPLNIVYEAQSFVDINDNILTNTHYQVQATYLYDMSMR